MTVTLLLGTLAGILQVGATIPYIISIIRGSTRPNTVSWFLWTCAVGITFFAQTSIGLSWSLCLLAGALVCNATVTILCLFGYGYKNFTKVDLLTLVFSLIAIVSWLISNDPLMGIIFGVIADCIAYAPTFFKMYHDPKSEQRMYWIILTIADMLALFSVTSFTPANIIFPIAYGLMNGVGLLILLQRSRTANFL